MHRVQEGGVLQGACLGGSVQRIRAQCIVLLHGSFARALSAPRAAHEAAACFPAPMNESAHALCWRAPAHCARRMRRVRGSFIATCCTCGESESVCLFCGVVSGVPVHDLCVWCVCVYVCIRRGTQGERPQNAQRSKPAGNLLTRHHSFTASPLHSGRTLTTASTLIKG